MGVGSLFGASCSERHPARPQTRVVERLDARSCSRVCGDATSAPEPRTIAGRASELDCSPRRGSSTVDPWHRRQVQLPRSTRRWSRHPSAHPSPPQIPTVIWRQTGSRATRRQGRSWHRLKSVPDTPQCQHMTWWPATYGLFNPARRRLISWRITDLGVEPGLRLQHQLRRVITRSPSGRSTTIQSERVSVRQLELQRSSSSSTLRCPCTCSRMSSSRPARKRSAAVMVCCSTRGIISQPTASPTGPTSSRSSRKAASLLKDLKRSGASAPPERHLRTAEIETRHSRAMSVQPRPRSIANSASSASLPCCAFALVRRPRADNGGARRMGASRELRIRLELTIVQRVHTQ